MKIHNFQKFEKFIKSRIPSREALFVGDIGLKRAKYFMKLLGNPQNKTRVIHIAGTSGKGSTTHLVSHLLCGQGFSVGMSISPHVFDIRERMQIDNSLPSKKLILKYFNQILPAIKKMEHTKFGSPTFFEINIALAYYMFAKEKLDYAIMETGLGGLLDATNTVASKNKVCIITKLGLDHTEILGKTISKITEQKAGIIQKNNLVISNWSSAISNGVIKSFCKKQNAKLNIIKKKNYKIISSSPNKTVFDFSFPNFRFENLKLGLIGTHQAENCSLALACLGNLSKRDDFKINENKLRKSLEEIKIIGRCEIRTVKKKTVIIDGAHNPQKMKAFISNLSKIYPNQKFTFLLAFKKGKAYKKMLKEIISLADKICLTSFSLKNQDGHWSSVDTTNITAFLKSQHFKKITVVENKKEDVLHAIQSSKNPVVTTGSLYLMGSLHAYLKNSFTKHSSKHKTSSTI